MGIEHGRFFLSHGGFVDGATDYGTAFTRSPTGQSPNREPLPPVLAP
jgi:hypothetical protein